MQKTLSKKEIKELSAKVEVFGISIDKKDRVIYNSDSSINYYIWQDIKAFFLHKNRLVPSLKIILKENITTIPSVYVDMGAIPFVIKGADIMRPGIIACENFPSKSIVVVRDETHKKPLSICFSSLSSSDLLLEEKGKVLQNLHYVGDKLWNL